jgi:hypothetical protein
MVAEVAVVHTTVLRVRVVLVAEALVFREQEQHLLPLELQIREAVVAVLMRQAKAMPLLALVALV